jgi:thiamine kinase-like enzyme
MMDSSALQLATLACLKDHRSEFSDAKIISVSPISGGYSRLTYKYEIAHAGTQSDIILQYVPKGSTGLVRVDRAVENDILRYLSSQNHIETSVLIASDVAHTYFDNAAFIFTAETERPFIEICREASTEKQGALNRIVARAAASVHTLDIASLPASLSRPTSRDHYIDAQIASFRDADAMSKTSRPFLRYIAKWLEDNKPPPAPLTLVHGDFQVSNMIETSDNKGGLLVDWELAHIGDPREDLGWFTMVCGAIPPNILEADIDGFYEEYRAKTGFSEEVINPATSAYFLIISSIRTHIGMMKSSDALAQNAQQSQSVLAAYYLNITSYQHMNWMNSVKFIESLK